MDTVAAGTPAPRRSRSVALVGAGLAAGLVFAGLTNATAQTPAPSPGTEDRVVPGKPDAPGERGRGRKNGHHKHKLRGDVLHGEHVVRAEDGTFRTLAVQNGEVTEVSATSITVRSADGFSRTYVVNGDTMVRSADEGIGDVAVGDTVHVRAVVAGGTATALSVVDTDELKRIKDRRRGPRDKPGAPEPSPSS